MQKSVNTKNLLKFILGSAFGVLMFLVPIPYGESFTTLLEFCNLSSGKRLSLLDSAAPIQPISVAPDTGSNTLLMLCYDENYGSHVICRWDLSRSTVADDRNYVVPRFTAQNPDQESLAQCQALAEENNMEFVCPSMPLCTDNAAMIGCAAYYEWKNGAMADMTLNAVANLSLD